MKNALGLRGRLAKQEYRPPKDFVVENKLKVLKKSMARNNQRGLADLDGILPAIKESSVEPTSNNSLVESASKVSLGEQRLSQGKPEWNSGRINTFNKKFKYPQN